MKNEHDTTRHELLCAYILGECSADERAEIERELARSPELRAQRATIEGTIGLVKDALAPSETLSPEAAATVLSAGAPARPSAWRSVPWMRIAAGLGAVALGALLVTKSKSRPGVESRSAETLVARVDERERAAAAQPPMGEPAPSDPRAATTQLGFMAIDPANTGNVIGSNLGVVDPTQLHFGAIVESPKVDFGVVQVPFVASSESGLGSAQPSGGGLPAVDVPSAGKRDSGDAIVRLETARVTDGSTTGKDDSFRSFTAGHEDKNKASTPSDSVPPDASLLAGLAGETRKRAAPATLAPPSADAKFAREALSGAVARTGSPSGPATGGPSGPSTGGAAPASRPAAKPGEVAQQQLKGLGYAGGGGAAPAEKLPLAEGAKVRRLADDRAGSRDADEEVERVYYWQLTPESQREYLDRECRRVLDGCCRRPNERPRDMFFRFWGDNPFEVAALDPLSTFGADVDTASYALARRYVDEGNVPDKAQIRTEEFVNYFASDVPAPTQGVFAIHTDLTPSRFAADAGKSMLRVVVRGKDVTKEERKPLHLTFVVDVSGSMREQNRLEMVKHSIRLLVSQLDQYDQIGIVKFSTDASIVLPLTSVAKRAEIEAALQPLAPNGSTNSNAGLELGYAIAMGGLDPNAVSRVVFLSDGVANVGETDPAKISERVRPMREKGIYLNTIGVGMNNHNDALLEQLANKSDGVCNYIDTPDEAKRALVDNFTGAFQPIARDVKIQVEFDPAQVLRYRLLGYENRAIADADFRNDKVDAGELGAGHQVTALYEIERQGSANGEKPLATVRLRWKDPRNFGTNAEQDSANEIARPVFASQSTTFEGAGQGYRRAAIVAQFAEILRRSIHARGDSLDDLLNEALRLQREIPKDKDFTEFVLLVSKSKDLILRTMPACDELCQAIDSVRESQYRMAQLEQLRRDQDQQLFQDLRRQNDELEARLRDLVRRRLESDRK